MVRNPTYCGTVYPWHCDHVGHMNVMWHVGKFDEATWNFFADIGLTSSYLRDNNRGMAAVEQRLTYARELHAGYVISINRKVLEVRGKVIRFTHEMADEVTGTACASCELTAVNMDTAARRAVAFPDEIIASLNQAAI